MKPGQSERCELRRKAEARLSCHEGCSSSSKNMVVEDAQALVQELQVHQTELEMQNEELKRAKLEVEDILTKYSDLYDFAPIGLLTFDTRGQILEVNLAGAALLGMERRNLQDRRFQLFIAPRDRPSFDDFCKLAFETFAKQTCELNLLRNDGHTAYVRIEGIATEGCQSNGRQCRIAVIDITERRQMEEELHKAKDKLEHRIQERTEELSQANKRLEVINAKLIDEIKGHARAKTELQMAKEEQEAINEKLQSEVEEHKQTEKDLLVAKNAAEAAAMAKSEFLANMSHEIRTPMNSVIGLTNLLVDNENLTPEQIDFIETIRTNGDALLSIINDILDFSKIECDKVMLEEQSFDLRACVEESFNLVAISAAEKHLNLACSIDKNVPDAIIGDPSRLRQILGNLLSNAVKFTDAGEVKVSVFSKQDDLHKIYFAVRDTGISLKSINRMNL